MAPRPERESLMITPPPAGTRRFALVLALSVLPMVVLADATPPPTMHPWKAAYVRRISNEGMEGRELRERLHKEAMRQWKKMQRAQRAGARARPAAPDAFLPLYGRAVPSG